MKVRTDNDSTKKVSIIDEIGASISYNMAAKRQPWSNLSTRLRLKWGSTTFNMNAVFHTYAYEFDKNGNVVIGDRTEWSYGRFGRFRRFQGLSKNLSYTFNNQSWKKSGGSIRKLLGKDDEEEDVDTDVEGDDYEGEDGSENVASGASKPETGDGELDADGYVKFSMPWSFSVSYGVTMTEDRSAQIRIKNMRYPYKFVHSLNFSGNLKLTRNWNVNFSSGYDFTNKGISMTTVNIDRHLHCFNINCGLVFGVFTSYHISLRANASTLTDALKYDKRSSYSSSIQWY